MVKTILTVILIVCMGSCSCNDPKPVSDCYECKITFITTGSDNDRTTENNVIKCNVTEEDIIEMERLAADTITAQDGVTVTTKAQCNKL